MSSIVNKYKDSAIKKRPQAVVTEGIHPADTNNFKDGEYKIVPIEIIQPNPTQPRQFFDEASLKELSESIKDKGVLQPLIIRTNKANKVWLVAGERRYRAAKLAGLNTVPCIITKGDPSEIALIENVQREDLKPIEEAEAYARLMEKKGYTQKKLAQVVGKGRTTITQTLSLNNLPDKIKKECPRVDIPKRILIEIARKKNRKEMVAVFEQLKGKLPINISQKPKSKQPQKRAVRTKSMIAINKASNLSEFLLKINLDSENKKDKISLLKELTKLKKQIDVILN